MTLSHINYNRTIKLYFIIIYYKVSKITIKPILNIFFKFTTKFFKIIKNVRQKYKIKRIIITK